MIRHLLFLTLAALPLAAQSPSDLDRKLTDKIAATLKESTAPSASVAVVLDGKLVFAKAFGNASLNPDRPATTETRYAVGSISKQFTAAALLLLQEQGKLSLDDKVSRYFPNLTRADEVTIRQLLSHTSGYEDYAPQDYLIPDWTKPTTPMAVVEGWAKKPLNFEPGTKWQYSNTNYVLAGEIFEKASGQPLLAFLKDKIFQPLGMGSAADWGIAMPTDAAAYTRFAGGPPRPVGREAVGWYFAAGELSMTPSDLAKWDISFLNKQILSPRSYEEFTREVRLKNGDTLISDQFNNRVIRVSPAGLIVTSYGLPLAGGDPIGNNVGYDIHTTQNGLYSPYDAKVIGDYTGLTPPEGFEFSR